MAEEGCVAVQCNRVKAMKVEGGVGVGGGMRWCCGGWLVVVGLLRVMRGLC